MKPNIILITVDTLRRDHCGCYGYERNTTPFIDGLSKTGIKFEKVFSNGPLTPRSFPSILCGAGAFDGKEEDITSYYLPKNLKTVGERLKEMGYYTIAFQAGNPFISEFYGYNRGFDEFYDYISKGKGKVLGVLKPLRLKIRGFVKKNRHVEDLVRFVKSWFSFFELIYNISNKSLPFLRGSILNKDVEEWLKSKKIKKPFFMWIHYMDVHQPHVPEKKSIEALGIKDFSIMELANYWAKISNHVIDEKTNLSRINEAYDCEIRYVDSCIEELFSIFSKNNITFNNSFFILTADHGEELGDHGGLGHMLKLYNEMLSVPFLVVGNRSKELTRYIDRVFDLKNIPSIIESVITGDEFKLNSEYIISESLEDDKNFKKRCRVFAIQNKSHKLIYNPENIDKSEFYDLKNDPKEKNNIFHQIRNEKIVKEMITYIKSMMGRKESKKIDYSIKKISLQGI